MSNKPISINFTHLLDDSSNLDFVLFKPSTRLDFAGGFWGGSNVDFGSALKSPLSSSADLNFDGVWQGADTDLIFGEPSVVDDSVNISITGAVNPIASGGIGVAETPTGISINATYNLNAIASGSMTAEKVVTSIAINAVYEISAVASGTASYDSNVDRLAQHNVSGDFRQSKITGIDSSGKFESNNLLTSELSTDWQQSKPIGTDNQVSFDANRQLQTSSKQVFEQAEIVGTSSKQLAEYQLFMALSRTVSNEDARLIGRDKWFGFEAMLKRQTERQLRGEYSELINTSRNEINQYSKIAAIKWQSRAETAKIPPWYYRPPEPEPVDPYDANTLLNFKCKWLAPNTWLDIAKLCQPQDKDEPHTQTGVIFVTNSVSLTRTDDGREIKLLGFSVGIDSNSYTWSFSATVPLSELSKVDTAHEQRIGVDFECNGNLWRFILDSCEDSIQFGESGLTIKGKSRAMLLAHPYATHRGFKFDTAMSARQIADAELNRGGVPSGFTLDWHLAGVNGWNVPANTYSYSNRTPINSLQWIAEAAGGFVNADMSADVLHVLANYPIPSWEWSAQTPSIELPMSLITSRSRGRVNKPTYNGVNLYGDNDNGIHALIKRAGTSGGYQPPMVTSDLMTDTAAAISRGEAILSDTGDIGNIGISMPLVADVGVLKPSTLIGVNDGEQWVGMVRGTTITGRLSSNRALEIDQSIDVERHFDKEIV
ncbi:hypothetical protein [uncultured Psychrobacter sp.]|uniref:hypothetical protein n=1 Tax=uncultured Psychrobacter sp. TaxID=259303 RepID=UPI0026175E59|nr:hypothetical protein [uncultured Psychrobacter sp.]